MAFIIDTSVLYALADKRDRYHQAAKKYLSQNEEPLILPGPVIPETCYMLLENLGTEAELDFLRSVIRQEFHLEHPVMIDLHRTVEILEQYRDSQFGMTDATIMAIAERMKIETIVTLDHRDFLIFRPRHCAAFRLVPELTK